MCNQLSFDQTSYIYLYQRKNRIFWLRKAVKKVFSFGCSATKALPAPSLVATFFRIFFRVKKIFFLSGLAFTPPPLLLVAGPLKKHMFFAASLVDRWRVLRGQAVVSAGHLLQRGPEPLLSPLQRSRWSLSVWY